jgi:hypothetical protein
MAGLEGRFGKRIKADLETDAVGDVWLVLMAGQYYARVRLATRAEMDQGSFKETLAPKAATAFDVFDQVTRELVPA